MKGRLEEAAVALTGDAELKKEGKLDQAAAEVKETVERVVDKAEDLNSGDESKLSGGRSKRSPIRRPGSRMR